MKDYYQILGVSPLADATEIRAAYRKMVQQYHPDVNPNPLTHEYIKEINEAYEVLGDVSKRAGYDFILKNPSVVINDPPKPHRDPAYRRRRPHGTTHRTMSAQAELMLKSLPYVLKIAWAGCFTCFIIMIDFMLPRTIEKDTVESFEGKMVGRVNVSYLITVSGDYYKVSGQDWQKVKKGDEVQFIYSGLFKILTEIYLPVTHHRITNLGTIYRNFLFVPLLLGGMSVLGVIIKKQVEFRFNLGIVTVFVLIFTWVLMFI